MIKNLSRDLSLRTFENQKTIIYGSNPPKNIHNFFALANKRNEKYFQKSFQCFYTAKGERSKYNQNTLNRVNSSSNFNENRSLNRKPLNQILKSNKQLSSQGLGRSQNKKILYKTCKTQTKNKLTRNSNSNNNKIHEKSQQKNVSNFNAFQDYQTAVEKNLSFVKLRQNVQFIKNLQSQMQKSISRSRSSKRKGLQCTLYQRSLQKKINQSEIKSNKKLVTVKKRFQKTENQLGVDIQAPKKDIKKVLLKRKNKDNQNDNQAGCFNSIIINENHRKNNDQQNKLNMNSGSLSKVQQNIRSVSKSKITEFNKLNRSISLIKQTCRNHNFDSAKKPSVQKKKRNSQQRKRRTVQKQKNQLFNQSSIIKGKKVTINEKVQENLNKIHQKYKFILSYVTDFDIIGKLNGYELAGKQECKWILLLIDQVYEMIKHSAKTKLKGIDYSRNYHYSSLKTE